MAPLGALCVAAAARAAGHAVDFLDLGLASSPQKALRQALAKDGYQAVAFGIRNLDNCWAFAPKLYFDEVRELAETVRSRFQRAVDPGRHRLFRFAPRLDEPPQGRVRRDRRGRTRLPGGARAAGSRTPAGGIDGVITAPRSDVPITVLAARAVERLSELPLPAHELCGYAAYVRRGGFVGVQTKRGCPFKCIYCIYPQLEGRRYRLRPPEAVVQEIEDSDSPVEGASFLFRGQCF